MLGTCEKPSSVSELEEQLDLVASYYKLLAQRNVPQVTKAQYTEFYVCWCTSVQLLAIIEQVYWKTAKLMFSNTLGTVCLDPQKQGLPWFAFAVMTDPRSPPVVESIAFITNAGGKHPPEVFSLVIDDLRALWSQHRYWAVRVITYNVLPTVWTTISGTNGEQKSAL